MAVEIDATEADLVSGDISYPDARHGSCFALDDTSFWYRHRNRCILTLLATYPPDGPVVDVGGGNGVVSAALAERGYGTRLVEPLFSGAANARARGVRDVVCGTIAPSCLREGSLSAVGLFDVLEHIAHDQAFLTELGRQMPENGLLYVTVPANAALWSSYDRDVGHFRRYSRESLVRTLERSGFMVEYATSIFTLLFPPAFAFRRLLRFGGKKREDSRTSTRGHLSSVPLVAAALLGVLSFECRAIAARRPLPFGTSLLAVAVRCN